MKKIKLTRTTVVEIDANPEWYPEGYTVEQMAEMEVNADDRESQFADNVISDEVKWEIVE